MPSETVEALSAPVPVPPARQYSFTGWQVNNPTTPPPGDRLDAEYDRLRAAILRVIDWVEASLARSVSRDSVGDANAASDAAGSAALAQDYAVLTQAWAEHMPDTIPPNILAVMDVTGDHWSSRWWANQAATTISDAIDEINDVGDFWLNQLPGALTAVKTLLYRAAANQTVFPLTTPDLGGNVYTISSTTPEPVEVYANGVRLPSDTPNPGNGDWTLNPATSTVTFLTPLLAGTMVQIDVLSKPLTTTGFLPLVGGTMSGPLTLAADPLSLMQAATKQYVDNHLATSYLPLIGAVMVNPLTMTFNNLDVPGNNSGQIIRWTNTSVPGVGGVVTAPLNILSSDYIGANSSIAGINVAVTANSMQFSALSRWPQIQGGSFTTEKTGNSWVAGLHITSREQGATAATPSNNPSSVNGALTGMEIAHRTQADDDGGLATAPGVRLGIHLTQAEQVAVASGGLPAVFAMGYNVDGSGTSITKSCFGLTGVNTYQVFDARTGTAPAGYTDPVAALRMSAGQIVDFNGASTATHAGWIGPAGSYLQYVTAAVNRLRWMSGAAGLTPVTEIMAINDLGQLALHVPVSSITGLPPALPYYPSIVLDVEQSITFARADNRTLKYTQVGTSRLAYTVYSGATATELFSVADSGRVTFGVLPINAANDAAAASAGVSVGGVYRNGSALMIRVA